jgi:lycopene cyclase domain-containing protein
VEGSALSFLYLGALLVSIAGLATLDFKFKLALGKNKSYRCLLIISVAFFLLWDLAGIALGIFFRGDATHLTGITISNELPLEEIFFLIVLSYSALILLKAFGRLVRR